MEGTATAARRRRTTGLPTAMAQVPFGVLRPVDAQEVYAQPRPEFRRLADAGLLHRTATGYYAVVPAQARDRPWLPTLEATAYGIAAATHGADGAILMGLSAARLHGALPRALAIAVVAVAKQRPRVALADRPASVLFVRRALDSLDAERVTTDLGTALVTSVEQTVLDLAHRPGLGGVPAEARAAVLALWLRCDPKRLGELAVGQRLGAALERVRQRAEG